MTKPDMTKLTKQDLNDFNDYELLDLSAAVAEEIERRKQVRRESLRLLEGKSAPKPRKPRADKGSKRKASSDDDKWDPDRNIAIGSEGGDTI